MYLCKLCVIWPCGHHAFLSVNKLETNIEEDLRTYTFWTMLNGLWNVLGHSDQRHFCRSVPRPRIYAFAECTINK